MSITITGIPFLLLSVIAGGTALKSLASVDKDFVSENFANSAKIATDLNTASYDCEETESFLQKSIETQIVDKDTLVKTLLEYGATITNEDDFEITADCEGLNMQFSKTSPEAPYVVDIKYTPCESPETMINEISEDYTRNAQEISYNKIKERLEEKNLEINEEEILEDDTIVLTINLE